MRQTRQIRACRNLERFCKRGIIATVVGMTCATIHYNGFTTEVLLLGGMAVGVVAFLSIAGLFAFLRAEDLEEKERLRSEALHLRKSTRNYPIKRVEYIRIPINSGFTGGYRA